ncbi:hypothetical protein DM01DRAFT_1024563 [Hesseltinella vesiculosa]|uniref:PQ-loop-domain-containing protein n=1 Tax=Hesseltinella vesiculosa TaxID=101127 RepID=A0A1X2GK32_9FUNG|nr:hypothetical protein DM01DRAFT_1024563 [Hesseltinella vesiculosa]
MDAGSVLLSIAMVIGPVVGYFDQVRLIVQSKSSAGFNRTTCAILLFANILRIFFWFGKRFDMTLLLQSIVMILAQLGLLAIVVRYRQKGVYANLGEFSPSSLSLDEQLEAELEQQDGLPPQLSRDSLGDDDRPLHTLPFVRRWIVKFWSWDRYLDYVNFLLFFTTFVGLLYLIFHSSSVFIEILGMLSLGIESTLPLPQCISNVQRKSTEGFSHLVLATWVRKKKKWTTRAPVSHRAPLFLKHTIVLVLGRQFQVILFYIYPIACSVCDLWVSPTLYRPGYRGPIHSLFHLVPGPCKILCTTSGTGHRMSILPIKSLYRLCDTSLERRERIEEDLLSCVKDWQAVNIQLMGISLFSV